MTTSKIVSFSLTFFATFIFLFLGSNKNAFASCWITDSGGAGCPPNSSSTCNSGGGNCSITYGYYPAGGICYYDTTCCTTAAEAACGGNPPTCYHTTCGGGNQTDAGGCSSGNIINCNATYGTWELGCRNAPYGACNWTWNGTQGWHCEGTSCNQGQRCVDFGGSNCPSSCSVINTDTTNTCAGACTYPLNNGTCGQPTCANECGGFPNCGAYVFCPPPAPTCTVSLSTSTPTISIGGIAPITANITTVPAGTTVNSIAWASSAPTVGTIPTPTGSGITNNNVTGVSAGTTNISATVNLAPSGSCSTTTSLPVTVLPRSWWQVSGGDVFGSNIVSNIPATCITNCYIDLRN